MHVMCLLFSLQIYLLTLHVYQIRRGVSSLKKLNVLNNVEKIADKLTQISNQIKHK